MTGNCVGSDVGGAFTKCKLQLVTPNRGSILLPLEGKIKFLFCGTNRETSWVGCSLGSNESRKYI